MDVTISDAQGQRTPNNRGTMDDLVEGDKIDTRKLRGFLPRPLRILVGRPLDASFCIDVTFPQLPTAIKVRANSSYPGKAVRRVLEFA